MAGGGHTFVLPAIRPEAESVHNHHAHAVAERLGDLATTVGNAWFAFVAPTIRQTVVL
jgi:hypothetical protein